MPRPAPIERQQIALSLKYTGMTFPAIAEAMKKNGSAGAAYSASAAYKDVQRELSRAALEQTEGVAYYKAEAIKTLERAKRALLTKVDTGDTKAVQALVAVVKELNAITAVYSAVKLEIDASLDAQIKATHEVKTGLEHLDDDELNKRVAEMAQRQSAYAQVGRSFDVVDGAFVLAPLAQ